MANKNEDNPYNSTTYKNEWKKHFDPTGESLTIKPIEGPEFIKKGPFSSYKNNTSNLTLQHFYQIRENELEELHGKLIIIYDVPSYFNIDHTPFEKLKRSKHIVINEYEGFLIDLNSFSSIEEYLLDRFSSRKKRAQFRSYIKKLEKSFDITYKMYHGEISRKEYEYLIDCFYELSIKSFDYRKIHNRKLEKKNFLFLKDIFYQLINEKKASLFVVFDENLPIGMTLNFNSETTLFSDSTVYDLDYFKFNVGTIIMIKQIEWCLSENITTYDFSKGHFQYKERWCNTVYRFEHHILYDSKIFAIKTKAFMLKIFLNLKQYLREHKVRIFLKDKVFNKKRTEINKFKLINNPEFNWVKEQAISLVDFPMLKKPFNDFLYHNGERKIDTKVYRLKNSDKTYLFQGTKSSQVIEIN